MTRAPASASRRGVTVITNQRSLRRPEDPGDGTIRARRVAILVADGVADHATELHAVLSEHGAVPRYLGVQLGSVTTEEGNSIEADATLETMPAVLFDALVICDGKDAVKKLGAVGPATEFIKEQFRHCKPILALGAGRDLVERASAFTRLPSGEPDPGLIAVAADELDSATLRFLEAIARHRHFERYADPPLV